MRVPKILMPLLCAAALGACDDEPGEDRSATILSTMADSAAGEAVFTGNCGQANCHGPDGAGGPDAPDPAPMPLGTLVPARSDEQIVTVLLDGRGLMPSQGGLTDQQLADVLAYLNVTFAN